MDRWRLSNSSLSSRPCPISPSLEQHEMQPFEMWMVCKRDRLLRVLDDPWRSEAVEEAHWRNTQNGKRLLTITSPYGLDALTSLPPLLSWQDVENSNGHLGTNSLSNKWKQSSQQMPWMFTLTIISLSTSTPTHWTSNLEQQSFKTTNLLLITAKNSRLLRRTIQQQKKNS